MNILLILAHADDETLGAGGAIKKWTSQGHSVRLIIVSDGIVAMRDADSDNRFALDQACEILGIEEKITLDFKDQQFETYPIAEIANRVSQHLGNPDLIITHSEKDLNQDHRIVNEVVKIVARPRGKQISILACEIPFVAAWNGESFQPQFFVDISDQLETKMKAFECYQNEIREFPDPYSSEGLKTLARYRGMEAGYEAAEGFEVIRMFENILL